MLEAHPIRTKKPTVTLVSVPDANRAVWSPQSGLILNGHKDAGVRWRREGSFMISCSQAECLKSSKRRHGGRIKAVASKDIRYRVSKNARLSSWPGWTELGPGEGWV